MMDVKQLRDKLNKYIEYGFGDLPVVYHLVDEDDRYEEVGDCFIDLDSSKHGDLVLVCYNICKEKDRLAVYKNDVFFYEKV